MNYPLILGNPGCAPQLTIAHVRQMRDAAQHSGVERTIEGFYILFVDNNVSRDVWTFALSIGVLINPSWQDAQKYIPASIMACEKAYEFDLVGDWETQNLLFDHINNCEAHRWHKRS